MQDTRKRREELAAIVDRQRQELAQRPDISQRMRELSESNSRNRIPVQPHKRPKLLVLILAAAAVATMLTCVGLGVLTAASGLWFRNQIADPSSTVLDFYSALHQQNYTQAYTYFSDDAKKQLSQDDFTTTFSGYDQVNGIIDTYTTQGNTQMTNGGAVVTVLVVRRTNLSQAQVQTVYLVQQGNDWRIQRITLGETVPAPTPSAS